MTGTVRARSGSVGRFWTAVRWTMLACAAAALAAAVALHPGLAARYLSDDGQLAATSVRALRLAEGVLVLVAAGFVLLWRRWREPTAARERAVLGVASLAGSLVASALCAELGLGLIHRYVKPLGAERHYFFEYDAMLGWRHRPGSLAMFKNSLVRIDGDGLRISGRERGPFQTRVLLLGDSQAFGDGVAAEQTFGARLEASRPGLRVLNASVIGYGTDQQLLYFERQVGRFAPEITIVALNAYDLRDNLSTRVRSGYAKPRFVAAAAGLSLTNVPVPGDGLADRFNRTLQRSHLYRLGSRMLRGAKRERSDDEVPATERLATEVYPDETHVERGLVVTAAILDRLAGAVRGAGSRLIVIFLPYQMDFGDNAVYARHTERVVRLLAARAQAGSYAFIDARQGLGTERADALFLDAMHLSPTGHQQVAAMLEPALAASLISSRTP